MFPDYMYLYIIDSLGCSLFINNIIDLCGVIFIMNPVFCDISIGVGGVGVHKIYCLVTLWRVYCKVLIVTNLHLIENIKTLSNYDDL
jgi:hypothetical protein